MKRSFLFALAATAAILLFSSCVYDPLVSGQSYGSMYYAGAGYNGGYYNGVYSDFYIGFYDDYYRYRHTRCRHCNHYPCRGGHSTRYYTYYRNYPKPLYGHPNHRNNHATASGRGYPASGGYVSNRSNSNRAHSSSSGAANRGYSPNSRVRSGSSHDGTSTRDDLNRSGRSPSSTSPRSNSRSLQNPVPYQSSPGGSRSSGEGSRSRSPRPDPVTVISTPRTSDADDQSSYLRSREISTPVEKRSYTPPGKSSPSLVIPSRGGERMGRSTGGSSSARSSSGQSSSRSRGGENGSAGGRGGGRGNRSR